MMIGSRILHFPQVTSTNDLCWQHAGHAEHHGLVIVTDEQTQGRGQRGRTWHAPPGSALLASMLIHLDDCNIKPFLFSLWASLGLCRVLESVCKLQARLKWPNDVLIQGKKVAGVLVEQRKDWLVVGVGFNLNVPADVWEAAQLNAAASVSDFSKIELKRDEVLQLLLQEWNSLYVELQAKPPESLLASWLCYSQLSGKAVKVLAQGQDYHGILRGFTIDYVMLEGAEQPIRLPPESIQAITLA